MEKSHHAEFAQLLSLTKNGTFSAAVGRKLGHCLDEPIRTAVEKSCAEFAFRLINQRFDSLALDYDGTVIENNDESSEDYTWITNHLAELDSKGVAIGFATGRDESIAHQLRQRFPKNAWDRVMIAMRNGWEVRSLAGDELLRGNNLNNPIGISPIVRFLVNLGIKDDWIERAPGQATIWMPEYDRVFADAACDCAEEFIRSHALPFRVLRSNRSFDIVHSSITKTSLVDVLNAYGRTSVLAMGDCGEFGGVDYDLLHSCTSLSVDRASYALDNCWNLASAGLSRIRATKEYISWISTDGAGGFHLEPPWDLAAKPTSDNQPLSEVQSDENRAAPHQSWGKNSRLHMGRQSCSARCRYSASLRIAWHQVHFLHQSWRGNVYVRIGVAI